MSNARYVYVGDKANVINIHRDAMERLRGEFGKKYAVFEQEER